MHGRFLLVASVLTTAAAGCARQPDLPYVDSKEVQKLKPEMKEKVHSILAHYCGTPQAPKLLGNDQVSPAHLKRGRRSLFTLLHPVPRQHGRRERRRGGLHDSQAPRLPAGHLQVHLHDLRSQAASRRLAPHREARHPRNFDAVVQLAAAQDQEAVVDYVLTLTHRGELETQLADEAVFNESIDQARVPEMITAILTRWNQARSQVVYPSIADA